MKKILIVIAITVTCVFNISLGSLNSPYCNKKSAFIEGSKKCEFTADYCQIKSQCSTQCLLGYNFSRVVRDRTLAHDRYITICEQDNQIIAFINGNTLIREECRPIANSLNAIDGVFKPASNLTEIFYRFAGDQNKKILGLKDCPIYSINKLPWNPDMTLYQQLFCGIVQEGKLDAKFYDQSDPQNKTGLQKFAQYCGQAGYTLPNIPRK